MAMLPFIKVALRSGPGQPNFRVYADGIHRARFPNASLLCSKLASSGFWTPPRCRAEWPPRFFTVPDPEYRFFSLRARTVVAFWGPRARPGRIFTRMLCFLRSDRYLSCLQFFPNSDQGLCASPSPGTFPPQCFPLVSRALRSHLFYTFSTQESSADRALYLIARLPAPPPPLSRAIRDLAFFACWHPLLSWVQPPSLGIALSVLFWWLCSSPAWLYASRYIPLDFLVRVPRLSRFS